MRISLGNYVSKVTDSWLLYLGHKMPRRKLFKHKLKNKKEDKSKIVTFFEEESVGAKCEEFPLKSYVCESEKGKFIGRKEKSSKQVHFTVLPGRYEPLEEDRTSNTAIEENQKGKQEKYKRFRKNIGKAFRYSWKCLVVGLQSFSTSYSGPLSAATTLVPEVQRTRPKA